MTNPAPSTYDIETGIKEVASDLWSDHKRVLFLLGAGASREGGLPLSREITRLALDDIGYPQQGRFNTEIASALRYACGALIKYDTDRGGSPTDLPDIERLVSAVELLSERNSLEVTPFIDSWDPMVDQIRHSTFPSFFDTNFRKSVIDGRSAHSPSKMIKQAIAAETGKGDTKIYGDLHLRLVEDLRKWVAIPDISKFAYLTPLLELQRSRSELTIATLNYDLSIEGQAQQLGLVCDTGITSWIDSELLRWDPDAINLLKLHGSISWSFVRKQAQDPQLNEDVIIESPAGDQPAVIFGQREKLRAKGPFLEIYGEFRRRLIDSDHLVVLGYSFQDDHVNEIIRRWMNRGAVRRMTIVDPYFPDHEYLRQGHRDFRQQLLWTYIPGPGGATLGAATQRLFPVRASTGDVLAQLTA